MLGWPITLFGTGKQVRDILYARDAVAAFQAFYENRQPGTYNIGGGERCMISLQESLDIIGHVLGHPPSVQLAEKRLGDLWYFVCDSSKAKNILGWEPKVMPSEGIAELIRWIQENPDCFHI